MSQYCASTVGTGALRRALGWVVICMLLAMPCANALAAGSTAKASGDQTVSLNQLADILENDKTRKQLITELREAASSEQTKTSAATGASSEKGKQAVKAAAKTKESVPAKHESFAHQFARHTAVWAGMASAALAATWDRIGALVHSGSGQPGAGVDWSAFYHSVLIFAVVAIATVIAFLILRALARLLFVQLSRLPVRSDTRRGMLWRRSLAIVLGIIVDIAVVLIAGAIGYIVGLYGVGDHGVVGTRQSLFINAFILIELVKVAIRAAFSARYDALRPLRIAPETSAWWSLRLCWFVGVIGYTLLVAVPIANEQLTLVVGAALSFIVMVCAYVYALVVIFGNRRLLTTRLRTLADNASLGFFSVLYRLFAHIWLYIALLYFTVLFVVSQLYPQQALPTMLLASVKTLILAVVCFSVSGLLSRAIGRRFSFSEHIHERLPMLEARLNAYVPGVFKAIRVIILVLFVVITLDIWSVFDFNAWLGSEVGHRFVGAALHVLLILALALVAWVIVASVIENRMSPYTGHGAPSARQQTLLALFRNTVAIVIVGFTIMIVLSQIGVNIGPLIAGAGVFGLAIGFGAQKLVQDIITGVFIQLENAMNTGDVVNLNGTWGTVERMTIRSVSLRDIDGGFHIIPFSSVSMVSNYMREFAYHRFEYRVAYRENIDDVIVHLREAFAELKADSDHGPNILEDMTVPGVTALDENAVKIRIMIKTVAGAQWGVGRAYNRLVKIHFDRAGIQIPFPQQTVYFGEDHDGYAPSAKIRMVSLGEEEETRPDYHRPRKRLRSDDEAPDETGDAPG